MEPEELERWQCKLDEFERIMQLFAKYTRQMVADMREQLNILEFRQRYRKEVGEDEN